LVPDGPGPYNFAEQQGKFYFYGKLVLFFFLGGLFEGPHQIAFAVTVHFGLVLIDAQHLGNIIVIYHIFHERDYGF